MRIASRRTSSGLIGEIVQSSAKIRGKWAGDRGSGFTKSCSIRAANIAPLTVDKPAARAPANIEWSV